MLNRKALVAGTRPDIGRKILMTASDQLDGYEIIEYRGMTWGTSIRSKDYARDVGMACKQFTGGELQSYTALTDESRQAAIDRMLGMAHRLGANGIINFRFDLGDFNVAGMASASVWGTAVKVVPIQDYVPDGAIGNILAEIADMNATNKQYEHCKIKIGPQYIGIECPACKSAYDITKTFGNIQADLDPKTRGHQIKCPHCKVIFSLCEIEKLT